MRTAFLIATLVGACTTAAVPLTQVPAANTQSIFSQRGYLDRSAYPDSLALLPPPPEADSPGFARDEAARASAATLRGTARFAQAARDADLRTDPLGAFSCAANVTISAQSTPRTHALLQRAAIDLGLSTYAAKNHYQRTRPFVAHNESTCFPSDEATLRADGSYPSGHSALGWGWALILAELAPARADAILQRGRDFGQSRVVCDAHWQSDVDAGRVIASAAYARLHADAAFRADVDAARAELTAAHAAPDATACTAEAAALRVEP
jgi:acid phosphatase (class A)